MKIRRFLLILLIVSLLCVSLAACNESSTPTDTTPSDSTSTVSAGDTDVTGSEQSSPSGDETSAEADVIDYSITFIGNDYKYSDSDAQKVDGKSIILCKPGTYELSGTLNDGTIVVEVAKTERVTLLLNNLTASCSTSAVIYVKSADRVYLDLKKGTTNILTDATEYKYASATETKPNACVYSTDDITIKGGGTLTVKANYNNGIGCKNDIDIKNGHVYVSAVNNAIKGNDSVTVRGDAELTITACEDAIKTDSVDEGKGFILITEEANVTITCNDDALQASQHITVDGSAVVTVSAGGDVYNCDNEPTVREGAVIVK